MIVRGLDEALTSVIECTANVAATTRQAILDALRPYIARGTLRAVDAGADGISVSNHGGRQLDSVASTISKLPPIVDAVGGAIEVLMDGGVRSGLDVFKALALGAKGVMIGRPWVWALSGAGERGLDQLLDTMQAELEVAMALSGVNHIAEIGPHLLDYYGV